MPKQTATAPANTAAATCRRGPSAPTISSVPTTSETENAIWWNTPRSSGRTSTCSAPAAIAYQGPRRITATLSSSSQPRLDVVERQVVPIVDAPPRGVEERVAVGGVAKLEPELPRLTTEPVEAQLVDLGGVRAGAILLEAPGWQRHAAANDAVLGTGRGQDVGSSGVFSADRWAAASAFFTRLRSRRSVKASSRTSLACVCARFPIGTHSSVLRNGQRRRRYARTGTRSGERRVTGARIAWYAPESASRSASRLLPPR